MYLFEFQFCLHIGLGVGLLDRMSTSYTSRALSWEEFGESIWASHEKVP